jgi:hypothetical protein
VESAAGVACILEPEESSVLSLQFLLALHFPLLHSPLSHLPCLWHFILSHPALRSLQFLGLHLRSLSLQLDDCELFVFCMQQPVKAISAAPPSNEKLSSAIFASFIQKPPLNRIILFFRNNYFLFE